MSLTKKEIIVIYHADCPDGFGGAFAAWKKFGGKAKYISVGHDDKNRLFEGLVNKEIYVIDFCFSESITKRLLSQNKRLTVIDHHTSEKDTILLTHKYSYDTAHSGAYLAWKYFHPGKSVPEVILYVEKIDLGKFKTKNAMEVSMVLSMVPYSFKAWNKIITGFEKSPAFRKKNLERAKVMISYEKKIISAISERAELVKFEGRKIYAVNVPSYFASLVGSNLIKKLPPMAIIWSERNGRRGVSLRSDGSVDVAKIAEKYGGGGSPQTSGFRIDSGKPLPWKVVSSVDSSLKTR